MAPFGMPRPSSQVVACPEGYSLGADPERAGLTLKSLDGSLHRLKFKLGCFAQDGQAHKAKLPAQATFLNASHKIKTMRVVMRQLCDWPNHVTEVWVEDQSMAVVAQPRGLLPEGKVSLAQLSLLLYQADDAATQLSSVVKTSCSSL